MERAETFMAGGLVTLAAGAVLASLGWGGAVGFLGALVAAVGAMSLQTGLVVYVLRPLLVAIGGQLRDLQPR